MDVGADPVDLSGVFLEQPLKHPTGAEVLVEKSVTSVHDRSGGHTPCLQLAGQLPGVVRGRQARQDGVELFLILPAALARCELLITRQLRRPAAPRRAHAIVRQYRQ